MQAAFISQQPLPKQSNPPQIVASSHLLNATEVHRKSSMLPFGNHEPPLETISKEDKPLLHRAQSKWERQ